MPFANLVAHCGARHVPEAVVAKVKTPKSTASWQPIPHIDLFKMVKARVMPLFPELIEVKADHVLSKDNSRYFGTLTFGTAADYGIAVAFRTSHDKSLAASLGLGENVFVCDNLALAAEVILKRKHTLNILSDLPAMLDAAVAKLMAKKDDLVRNVERMKESRVTEAQLSTALIDLTLKRQVLGPSALRRVWDAARITDTERDGIVGGTVWALYNAVTAEWRGIAPWSLAARSRALLAVTSHILSEN